MNEMFSLLDDYEDDGSWSSESPIPKKRRKKTNTLGGPQVLEKVKWIDASTKFFAFKKRRNQKPYHKLLWLFDNKNEPTLRPKPPSHRQKPSPRRP